MIVSAADRPISRTAYLHVDYRKVTPIDEPLISRGRIDRIDGRKAFITATMTDSDGTVLSEANGLMIKLLPAPALRGVDDRTPQHNSPSPPPRTPSPPRSATGTSSSRATAATPTPQIVERSNRLAAYLHSRGLGCNTERAELAGHEVGQDLLGIYAYNGPEYVEAMLGAWRARVAPFNVNYRYVKNELQYLLADSGATALIYHAAFAPRVAEVLPELPNLRVLIQIADDSGNDLRARRRRLRIDRRRPAHVEPPPVEAVPRRPVRAVHRRHDRDAQGRAVAPARHLHDVVRRPQPASPARSSAPRRDRRAALPKSPGTKLMILPPLMHGAAQWAR